MLTVVACKVVGTLGAIVSGTDCVVADAELEFADKLLAPSTARTVYEYKVFAARPVSE